MPRLIILTVSSALSKDYYETINLNENPSFCFQEWVIGISEKQFEFSVTAIEKVQVPQIKNKYVNAKQVRTCACQA